MPFQLNASQLFLTYPQCTVSKDDVLRYLQTVLDFSDYVVAHELHANGDSHIHAYLKLLSPLRTRDSKLLDLLYGDQRFHGNYQGCRSCKNVVKYVSKGEDYLSNMDLSDILNRKSQRQRIAEKLILGKRSLEEVIAEHPELIFGYQKLKTDLLTYKADHPEEVSIPDTISTPWNFDIRPTFTGKKRHYWIFSTEPNRGKTTFGFKLSRDVGAFIAAGDCTYWNVDISTPIVILDDYNTRRFTGDTLNQLCDGTYQFRVFQRGVVKLAQYIVIVFSNSSISDLYCAKFVPLLNARFEEHDISNTQESNDLDLCLYNTH